jgi:DNA-directed RNA polymerase subunit M/transcription elongation factor TFIIS
LTRRHCHANIASRVPTALQFICNKCKALSNVHTFEQTRDGLVFCRCDRCGTKNKVVHAGQTPSQPGLLPVTGVIQ